MDDVVVIGMNARFNLQSIDNIVNAILCDRRVLVMLNHP